MGFDDVARRMRERHPELQFSEPAAAPLPVATLASVEAKPAGTLIASVIGMVVIGAIAYGLAFAFAWIAVKVGRFPNLPIGVLVLVTIGGALAVTSTPVAAADRVVQIAAGAAVVGLLFLVADPLRASMPLMKDTTTKVDDVNVKTGDVKLTFETKERLATMPDAGQLAVQTGALLGAALAGAAIYQTLRRRRA